MRLEEGAVIEAPPRLEPPRNVRLNVKKQQWKQLVVVGELRLVLVEVPVRIMRGGGGRAAVT